MSIWGISSRTGITSVILSILFVSLFFSSCRPKTDSLMLSPVTAPEAIVDPWKEAALKVEQDRGEPMGRAAKVEVPTQLKHYTDSRRFLGTQLAESRQHRLKTPSDFVELLDLIGQGELVELSPLGKHYILYGVGMMATDGPFTHYDKSSGKSVTLYANEAELKKELDLIGESEKTLTDTNKNLIRQRQQTPRRETETRQKLDSQLKENRTQLNEVLSRKQLLTSFYGSAKSRQALFSKYEKLAAFAKDFGGRAYDLNDPGARKELKVKLLSYLRPAAFKVLEELAQVYQNKFGRPLPITSLIRPDEYQAELRETNRNATSVDVPPHTTGLAFDVFYRFMSAAEQDFVMAALARMRDAGRIEALRELRNHYHVFAFINGKPPEEQLIRRTLEQVGPPR
jgi:hypothetical protein